MNIILVTTGMRSDLLGQTINSLVVNAANRDKHTLTIVQDGYGHGVDCFNLDTDLNECNQLIVNLHPQGASASRNIGAASIPKYRRQEHVMFIDDDVYMCSKWDEYFEHVSNFFRPGSVIISGHAHPFNHTVLRDTRDFYVTNVLSTLNLYMSWSLWDDVGFFLEPGGPGGSEDVDYCRRATEKNYNLAVMKPQRVIHCGLTSSSGKQIVGYDQMIKQNDALVELHGLQGVKYE